MKLPLLHVLMRRKAEDTIRVVAKTLWLVKSQELEVGALIFFNFWLKLNKSNTCFLVERLDASVVLPDEALEFGRAVSQLRGSLRQDLVRVRLVHVVSHSLTSLVLLVSGHETTWKRVVFLEFVVTSSLVIAENWGNGQVLGTSVKDNSGGLSLRRSHVNSTEVDSVIAAVQWNLQLQVIFVVNARVGYLRDQLGSMSMGLLIWLLIRLQILNAFDVVTQLSQASHVLLAPLSQLQLSLLQIKIALSALDLSKLRVVHFITVKQNLFGHIWHAWSFNNKVDICALFQL